MAAPQLNVFSLLPLSGFNLRLEARLAFLWLETLNFWVVHKLNVKSLRPAACLSAAQFGPCEDENIALPS